MPSKDLPPKNPQQQRRESSAPPDSVTPKPDSLPGDLRRTDQRETPPDSLPQADEDIPVTGHSLAPDGGVAQHPIHDDDPEEDFTPGDYEEQIDKVADTRRGQRERDIAAKD
jgi:hypothetical protein